MQATCLLHRHLQSTEDGFHGIHDPNQFSGFLKRLLGLSNFVV